MKISLAMLQEKDDEKINRAMKDLQTLECRNVKRFTTMLILEDNRENTLQFFF